MSEELKFELIRSRTSYLLHLSGFLYYKNSGSIGARAYWLCKEAPECDARATTKGGPDNLELVKGSPDDHYHEPEPEEVTASKVMASIKRRAKAHPEAPPAQIIRTELRSVPSG